jgi:hypothetical protein
MKKLVLLFSVAALFAACNDAKKDDAKPADAMTTAKAAPSLPFTATYSSSFEMGDRSHEAMIEQGSWKDWQDNKMNNLKSWVADTIVAVQSDNSMTRGVDSLQARWNRSRANYTSVKDSIDAVMSVYSTDKKENWVLVWAKEIATDLKGKTDTASIMETWRINKDGKADFLLQYDRATRKK